MYRRPGRERRWPLLITAFALTLPPMTSLYAKQIYSGASDLDTPAQLFILPTWTQKTRQLNYKITGHSDNSEASGSNAQDIMEVSPEKQLRFTHRNRADNINIQTHLTAKYEPSESPIADEGGDPVISGEQKIQVDSFYLAVTDPEQTMSARFGRQSFDMVDTPYQFDGFAFNYRFLDKQQVKLAAGYPQAGSSPADVDTKKFFYGISAESELFAKYWRADVYAFEHTDEGVTSHRIMGSKLNFLHPRHPAVLGLDHHPNDRGPSSAFATFSWHPRDDFSVEFALDYRNSSRLKEHSISALDELLKSMTDEEIKSLEQDPTAEFKSGTLSWEKKLNHEFSLNAETSIATLNASPTTGPAQTKMHRLFGLQLTGSGLIKPNDSASLNVRYFKFEAGNRVSLSVKNDMPIQRSWQANVQLEADWQKNKDQSEILSLGPLFRLQHNKNDKTKFEFEIGVKRSEFLNRVEQPLKNDYFFNITHSREL